MSFQGILSSPMLTLILLFLCKISHHCLFPVVCFVMSDPCDPMDCSPPGSSVHGDSPGKSTGGGCHTLLQGIFPTQRSNPGLLHCRWIVYQLSYQGSPKGWLVRSRIRTHAYREDCDLNVAPKPIDLFPTCTQITCASVCVCVCVCCWGAGVRNSKLIPNKHTDKSSWYFHLVTKGRVWDSKKEFWTTNKKRLWSKTVVTDLQPADYK